MGEAKVKSYTRKTKSGKTVQVRAHSRKCEGGSCSDKKGAGTEFRRYYETPEQKKRIEGFKRSDKNGSNAGQMLRSIAGHPEGKDFAEKYRKHLKNGRVTSKTHQKAIYQKYKELYP